MARRPTNQPQHHHTARCWTTLQTVEQNPKQWNGVKGLSVNEIKAVVGKFSKVSAAEGNEGAKSGEDA